MLLGVGPFMWVTDGRTGRWETGAVEEDPGKDALAAVAGCRRLRLYEYRLTLPIQVGMRGEQENCSRTHKMHEDNVEFH